MIAMTIGTVFVVLLRAEAADVPPFTMTSTLALTSSAACSVSAQSYPLPISTGSQLSSPPQSRGPADPRAMHWRVQRPAELINESWVLPPPESPPGEAAVEAFRISGLEYPRVTVFAILPEVRLRLLATGRFLTIFPNSVLANSKLRSTVRVLPVKMTLPHIPTGIVTLKNRTLSPAAKLFIGNARDVAKSLTANKP
jgi:DNA-binding transcriptional LysR family regulator